MPVSQSWTSATLNLTILASPETLRAKMNIVLDARTVGRRFSGVGFYVLELVRAFSALDLEHRFHLLVHGDTALDDLPMDGRRFQLHRTNASSESHPWGDLWEEIVLPRLAVQWGADVLHGPAFLIPLHRTRIPSVVTIHDLVAFTHPRTIPWKYAAYMRWRIRHAVRAAQSIICDSESAKRDVMRFLGASPESIATIHLGVAEHFRPQTRERIQEVCRRYRLERPYILFVGNVEPRKNLPNLVRAFRILRQESKEIDLAVAGQIAWKSKAAVDELSSEDVQSAVRFCGYIPTEDLPALYSGAEAFVFPTLWEGFGLPVLEAMACGAPVVASKLPPIEEIAGGAAIFVDPHSPESIASGIRRALGGAVPRAEWGRRGIERAARFSWMDTARKTLQVYESAQRAEK
jgi:glycosyltransferase involved in cell wall biosynthesis